jgi:uncharacterized SAM-binding protein YcdF (DUF218 family)
MEPTMTTNGPGPVRLTPSELAARKRRNLFIALALVAFMVLLFTTTMLRLFHNQQLAREARAAAVAAAPQAPAKAPASSSVGG